MRNGTRHAAVFLLILAAATTTAFVAPLSVDPRDVFLAFMLTFIVYLAASLIWQPRRRK